MKYIFPLLFIFSIIGLKAQVFIDHVNNNCPDADILTACIGDGSYYTGQFAFKTYNHSCQTDTLTGIVRIYRNLRGEYLVDDFSFGLWPQCFGVDGPSGTLRLNINCSDVSGVTGTDNFGDVWSTGQVEYTGHSLILSWFNTYPDYGTTELTPLDGRAILPPSGALDFEYDFEWSNGQSGQSIDVYEPGNYSVTVTDEQGVYGTAEIVVVEDPTVFLPICSGEILDVGYFMDYNENGVREADEPRVEPGEEYIDLDPNYSYRSIENNLLERYVLHPGSFTFNDVHPFLNITNLPSPLDIEKDAGLTSLNLGLISSADVLSADVSISSSGPLRCWWGAVFYIKVKNTGSVAFNDRVTINYDPAISYIGSDRPTAEESSGIVSWDLNLEHHGETQTILLYLRMPSQEYIGELLCLTPEYLADTKSSEAFCFELTCSYDPNDKHGTPFRGGKNPTYNGEEINYTIRFENLGNDTAFDIRVEDSIGDLFDLNSFRFIQSSHKVTRYYTTSDRRIVFEMDDIQLPSVEQDTVQNKGFVQFSISPLEDLSIGTELHNTAGIFFDFNDPVITNTTRHTLEEDLLSSNNNIGLKNDFDFALVPNPARHSITLESLNSIDYCVFINAQGQQVKKQSNSFSSIDISALAPGFYLVLAYSGESYSKQRLIIF